MKKQVLPIWDLSRFYSSPTDPKLAADMKQIEGQYRVFAKKYKGHIATLSSSEMEKLLIEIEKLDDAVSKVGSYARLLSTTDTINPVYNALLQKVMEWGTELGKLSLFFGIEWKLATKKQAAEIVHGIKNKTHAHYLTHIREFSAYALKEDIEEVILEKDLTGSASFVRLFDQITSTFSSKIGEKSFTQSEVLTLVTDKKRSVRKKAANAFTKTLTERGMELTHIYNTLIADKMIEEQRRGYKTWITGLNLSNKITDQIVENLVNSVTARYDIVSKHYEFKRKLLKLPTLYEFDRYAPIVFSNKELKVTWAEARDTVQKAYDSFNPEAGQIIREFFDGKYIHATLLPNKRGGAFCATTATSVHPYILMNYTERKEDVMTLAHELGHGLHQYLAGRTQGNLGQGMPLTTQELASTFGEMITFNYLKSNVEDPRERLSMLIHKIDGMIATVFRQITMFTFEQNAHTRRRTKGELSSEDFSEIWMESQRAMFGKSVTLRQEYSVWWSYIPHFIHTPGYVYSYAFGELLALSLYNQYIKSPADFTPKYMQLLKSGDSNYPEILLKKLAIDITKKDIWLDGLELIEKLVEEEIELSKQI